MIDVKTADRELQTYIRPQTFPVAIRMLKPGEPIPERARRPARDFKKLSMNCQVIDMARRYGWTIALTREDHICSLGITASASTSRAIYNVGTLCEGMYTETKEAGQRSEAAIDKFAPGEYSTPPRRAARPRHLRARTWSASTPIPPRSCGSPRPRCGSGAASWPRRSSGRVDCADIIVTTMQTDEPQVILPCSGDRIFGQTQDHEMAFTIPWARWTTSSRGCAAPTAAASATRSPSSWSTRRSCRRGTWRSTGSGTSRRARRRYTNRDRVVAAYKRSFADRVPVYPIVASFAGTLDGLSIEEYCTESDAGHHGDDELLRALPARRGARLQRPRQGGRGLRLRGEVLRLRRPVDRARTCCTRTSPSWPRCAMPDPYKTARLPGFLEQCEALVKAGAARGHRRGGGRPVDDRDAAAQPRDRCCSTPSRTRSSSTTSCGSATDFCKAVGRRHRQDEDRAQLLGADRLDQPDLARQLPGVHRALPQGAGRPLQGQEGRRHHAHLRHDLPDLRGPASGCGFTTVSFDLDQQSDPTLHVDQLDAVHGGRQGTRRRHRQRGRDQVREGHAGRRSRPRSGAAWTPRRATRGSSCPRRARSRRARTRRS